MDTKYIPKDMIPLEVLKAKLESYFLVNEFYDIKADGYDDSYNGFYDDGKFATALKMVIGWIETPAYDTRLIACGYIPIPAEPAENEIFIDAINHYGADAQTAKAVEELAELQQALCKYLCTRSESVRENIIEEIADVEIMLQQIKMIFNINQSGVENVKNFKLSRLAERIAADTAGVER